MFLVYPAVCAKLRPHPVADLVIRFWLFTVSAFHALHFPKQRCVILLSGHNKCRCIFYCTLVLTAVLSLLRTDVKRQSCCIVVMCGEYMSLSLFLLFAVIRKSLSWSVTIDKAICTGGTFFCHSPWLGVWKDSVQSVLDMSVTKQAAKVSSARRRRGQGPSIRDHFLWSSHKFSTSRLFAKIKLDMGLG